MIRYHVFLMPIYEYLSEAPADPDHSCRVCSRGFELRRPIDREPLRVCPLCKNPVKKVISRINTPAITKPLSVSDAKSAGFTILERRDQGVYEKL
jgi:putative FmdB family regulatory protein